MPTLLRCFLVIAISASTMMINHGQFARAQHCLDGEPAVFPCNATRVAGHKVFVCALDLNLGCEQIDGSGTQFYCCAHHPQSLLEQLEVSTASSSSSSSQDQMQMLVDRIVMEEMEHSSNNLTSSAAAHLAADSSAQLADTLEAMVGTPVPGKSSENVSETENMNNEHQKSSAGVSGESGASINDGSSDAKAETKEADRQTLQESKTMLSVERKFSVVDQSIEKRQEQQQTRRKTTDMNAKIDGIMASSTMGPDNMTTTTSMAQMNMGMMDMNTTAGNNNNNNTTSNAVDMSNNNGTTMMTTTTTTAMASTISALTRRPLCIDIGPQCLLAAKLCRNPQYSRLVHLQCPRTCNLCAPDGNRIIEERRGPDGHPMCVDRGKDCARAQFLCRTAAFTALMASECAKTCGRCSKPGIGNSNSSTEIGRERKPPAANPPTTGGGGGSHARGVKIDVDGLKKAPPTTTTTMMMGEKEQGGKGKLEEANKCVDGYPRCFVWRLQGFCTSRTYSLFLRRRYCAQTCGLCASNGEQGEEKKSTK